MKHFACRCGQSVFFDNDRCGTCGVELGFDPQRMDMVCLTPGEDGVLAGPDGTCYRHCRNRLQFGLCNWLLTSSAAGELCTSCATSVMIPNLAADGNLRLWGRLELSKRRLFYSLLSLGLPLARRSEAPLRFAFKEDQSRNPNVYDSYVGTGHHDGLITINVAEADDSARHAIREQMREHYRTLLGHFRHEAGHYYFDYLVTDPGDEEFVTLFGDWRQNYAAALERYYAGGPGSSTGPGFISAYASSHPVEDWAEIFAHYLHITETLETADWALPEVKRSGDWIVRWLDLSLRLNELNRSLGAPHPYPFVLSDRSIAKLRFLDARVRQAATTTGPAPAAAGAPQTHS